MNLFKKIKEHLHWKTVVGSILLIPAAAFILKVLWYSFASIFGAELGDGVVTGLFGDFFSIVIPTVLGIPLIIDYLDDEY